MKIGLGLGGWWKQDMGMDNGKGDRWVVSSCSSWTDTGVKRITHRGVHLPDGNMRMEMQVEMEREREDVIVDNTGITTVTTVKTVTAVRVVGQCPRDDDSVGRLLSELRMLCVPPS